MSQDDGAEYLYTTYVSLLKLYKIHVGGGLRTFFVGRFGEDYAHLVFERCFKPAGFLSQGDGAEYV